MYSRLVCMEQRKLRERVFHTPRNGVVKVSGHHPVFTAQLVVERYIQNQEKLNAKSLCAGSVLKSGV